MSFRSHKWGALLYASAFSLAAAILVSGCVPIPIAADEEMPFDEAELAFLVSEQTTRDEIETHFVEIDSNVERISQPDDPVAIYHGRHRGGGVMICGAGEFMIGCEDFTSVNDYFAVFMLDTQGLVTGYEIKDAGDLKDCDSPGLCQRRMHLVLHADDAIDARAKDFVAPPEECSLYVYAKTGFAEYMNLFRIDEGRPEYLYKDDFLLLSLEPGIHTAWSGEWDSEDFTFSAEFDCPAGQVVFMDASKTGATFWKGAKPNLSVVAESVGREQIAGRQLALATYPFVKY